MRPTLFPRVLALLLMSIALLCLGALLGSGGIMTLQSYLISAYHAQQGHGLQVPYWA